MTHPDKYIDYYIISHQSCWSPTRKIAPTTERSTNFESLYQSLDNGPTCAIVPFWWRHVYNFASSVEIGTSSLWMIHYFRPESSSTVRAELVLIGVFRDLDVWPILLADVQYGRKLSIRLKCSHTGQLWGVCVVELVEQSKKSISALNYIMVNIVVSFISHRKKF